MIEELTSVFFPVFSVRADSTFPGSALGAIDQGVRHFALDGGQMTFEI